MTTAELSRILYSPVTLLLLTGGMVAHLYAAAYGRVSRSDDERTTAGRRARLLGTVFTVLGIGTLLAHMVTRSIAAERLPLGNMFEFSTVMALTVLIAGIVVVQWRLRRPELMGFLLLGAILTMGLALLVYDDPGPLMPILDSWWRGIHVSAIVFAAGIFTVAFVFTGLYLIRDSAERGVAAMGRTRPAGSVGAASASDVSETTAVLDSVDDDVVPGHQWPDADGSDARTRPTSRRTAPPCVPP